MNLVVLGAPGAGKGTQAVFLARHFGLDHISTGDMLRDEMKAKTEVGVQIQALMDAGRLVPDEIAIKLVKPRIKEAEKQGGYILDGFPRNIYQAEILPTLTQSLDAVIQIDVADSVIVERISGRLVCPGCGATFHEFYHPPIEKEKCDGCGVALIRREDDKTVTVLKRLAVYREMTAPIVAFYKRQGLLKSVSGVGDVQDIFNCVLAALEEKRHGHHD